MRNHRRHRLGRDPVEVLLGGSSALEYRGYDSAGVAFVDATGTAARRASGPPSGRDSIEELGRARAPRRRRTARGDRAHPLGDPWRADRARTPTRTSTARAPRRRAQRHHRELPRARRGARRVGPHAQLGDRHRGRRPPDRRRARRCRARSSRRCARCWPTSAATSRWRVISSDEPDVLVAARRTSPLVIGLADGVGFVGSDIAALLGWTRELYSARRRRDRRGPSRHRSGSTDLDGNPVDARAAQGHLGRRRRRKRTASRTSCRKRSASSPARSPTPDRATARRRRDRDRRARAQRRAPRRDRAGRARRRAARATTPGSSAATPSSTSSGSRPRSRSRASSATATPCSSPTRSSSRSASPARPLDTLHAMREAARLGATTLAMTNVVDSLMAREADGVLYTHAGPEIGVASTKCHLAQLALLEVFALHLAEAKGRLDAERAPRDRAATCSRSRTSSHGRSPRSRPTRRWPSSSPQRELLLPRSPPRLPDRARRCLEAEGARLRPRRGLRRPAR